MSDHLAIRAFKNVCIEDLGNVKMTMMTTSVTFDNNSSLNNFLVITKTTEYEDVEANTNMMSACLFIEIKKIAQVVN